MADQLTLLFTNIWLADRGGSEAVVRDLALGMLRRGHRPIVYSPTLGEAANELAEKGIVVIDDLRRLAEPPDLIHAHHAIPCGEALIRFPRTPAIYTCHAFAHWAEAPVHFPQIAAYIAVDQACRDRLIQAEGIEADHVLLMPNVVDLARIPARTRPLSERPKRAIAFGKSAAAPELRRACERLGIAFESIGYVEARPSAHPEQALVAADLVFASARSALEAICCGCAVIACDTRGIAGLVTSENVDALRARNFGLRSFGEPVTVERCSTEIQRYDPKDATRVSERMWREADLETRLDAFEDLYGKILSEKRRRNFAPAAHERAVARFLHDYLPRRPADPRWLWISQREEMLREIEQLESRLTEASARAIEAERASEQTRQMLEAQLAQMQSAAVQAQQALEARLSAAQQAAEEVQRALEVRLADAERMVGEDRQRFETRLAETDRAANQVRRALEAKVADAERMVSEDRQRFETRLAETNRAADQVRRALEAKVADAERMVSENRQVFERRLAGTDRAADQVRRALEAKAADAEQRTADARRELAGLAADSAAQNARIVDELNEAMSALAEAKRQLAELKRSRMLRVGRFLRRVAGRPVAY